MSHTKDTKIQPKENARSGRVSVAAYTGTTAEPVPKERAQARKQKGPKPRHTSTSMCHRVQTDTAQQQLQPTSPQALVRVTPIVALGVKVAAGVVDGAGGGAGEGQAQTADKQKQPAAKRNGESKGRQGAARQACGRHGRPWRGGGRRQENTCGESSGSEPGTQSKRQRVTPSDPYTKCTTAADEQHPDVQEGGIPLERVLVCSLHTVEESKRGNETPTQTEKQAPWERAAACQ